MSLSFVAMPSDSMTSIELESSVMPTVFACISKVIVSSPRRESVPEPLTSPFMVIVGDLFITVVNAMSPPSILKLEPDISLEPPTKFPSNVNPLILEIWSLLASISPTEPDITSEVFIEFGINTNRPVESSMPIKAVCGSTPVWYLNRNPRSLLSSAERVAVPPIVTRGASISMFVESIFKAEPFRSISLETTTFPVPSGTRFIFPDELETMLFPATSKLPPRDGL